MLVAAGLSTALVGVVIGLPTLRLRGDYLAIVTLGFGEILPQIARNGDNDSAGFNLTNGPQGINPIDPPGFGNWLSRLDRRLPARELPDQPRTARSALLLDRARLLALHRLLLVRLRDSRLGRAWIAIREDETAAAAMGIPLMRTKTWAYAIGAFFGGIAGACFAAFKSGDVPDDFFFNISVFILCMVILGGMGNVWGVIARRRVPRVPRTRRARERPAAGSNATHFGSWRHVDVPLYPFGIYGVILVLVMLFGPQGLIPSATPKREFTSGVHDEPLYDVQTHEESPMTSRRDGEPARRSGCARSSAASSPSTTSTSRSRSGSIVSLIGPNGAGKTTFFNMLTGVYKPTAGTVVFDGDDVTGKPPHAITERGIGRTFQNIRLFQEMTALENVLVGMHCRLQERASSAAILRTPRVRREEAEARERARELLDVLLARPAGRTTTRATCRTATSAGSRSRARSRPSRSCCCSTSRPPA